MPAESHTFTAVLRGPLTSENDLLIRLLCDYGVVSAGDPATALAGVSTEALGDTLRRFLIGLAPLRATAALRIENPQDLSPAARRRLQALSSLEVDGRRLLHVDLGEDDAAQFCTASWSAVPPVAGLIVLVAVVVVAIGLTATLLARYW